MLLILTILFIIFNTKINYWYLFAVIDVILIYIVWKIVGSYEQKIESKNINEASEKTALKFLRYWYGVAAILYIFKQVYIIIYSLKLPDWDLLFIKMDFILFGLNPTQWAHRFENPVLTEFLQIVYAYYYPMIVVFGLELYLWKRYKEYKYTIFLVFFSFYFSYILYMLFPANG